MGDLHVHAHGPPPRATPRIRRRLAIAVVPFAIATLVGMFLLRPTGEIPAALFTGDPPDLYDAVVLVVTDVPCEGLPVEGFRCAVVDAMLEGGPDEGDAARFELATGAGTRHVSEGDGIVVGHSPESPPEQRYYFVDFQRSTPLTALAVIFAVMVVALSRWRGLAALAGLAVSLVILVSYILPSILEGRSPLAVSIVGAAAIMFVTLYLAHGLNVRTTSAILGTLVSLSLTGVLAYLFIEISRFTGLGSEEAAFLQVSAAQINLQGLLLGGIIIGALGVMDDVTITQASAVWELHRANPAYGARDLFASALRIGRDHIAATVNTLVLAYAGAALPLLILFSLSDQAMGELLTREVVAEEIVRTLVGSIGLIASVPITTGLAAMVATGDRAERTRVVPAMDPDPDRAPGARDAAPDASRAEDEGFDLEPEDEPKSRRSTQKSARKKHPPEEDFVPPKAEREWREGF